MHAFEKLGAFYLGKTYDAEKRSIRDELLLYDAKDLTTHAVCVGMTGSGKTGLCLSLLEEAAIDGIPTLAIDPKGDLGNLMLTFPELRPEDFRPWIDEAEATRKGSSPDDYAGKVASQWKSGLAQWGQDGTRIARFRDSAEVSIYTPGSSAGRELSVLRSFNAPSQEIVEDRDLFQERISAAVSGLLALMGIDADPIRSREHIFLSNILRHAWCDGRSLDIPGLIGEIQSPPFEKLGVMDLDSFYPAKDRFALAMDLNNLLASPGFAGWLEGDPLDVARLLWTPRGKPRISILSIAHLSDAERMFFVTLLLGEVVSWMRTQSGTSSLRALLYMDEVAGFFPPTANPPSKPPMLTLMKQARAFGLGIVLASQNPVDLDYKGLSNAGTWFLGRLQTERDKARVIEGLEGASAAAGSSFDRQEMERTLAGLDSRVFLMNNVHDDEPVLFHSRWALSYLRGPLTRRQVKTLMAPRKGAAAVSGETAATVETRTRGPARSATSLAGRGVAARAADTTRDRPVVAPDVPQYFLPRRGSPERDERVVYRPALLGTARLHFIQSRLDIDTWETVSLLAELAGDSVHEPWEEAADLETEDLDIREDGDDEDASYSDLPAEAARAKSYRTWKKDLAEHLYRTRAMTLWKCGKPKLTSLPGESEGEFRIRLTQLVHEKRDEAVEKLRKRYTPKLARLRERIRKAEERVSREKSQFSQQKYQTALSFGATILGALFGRKLSSRGNVGRAATTARGVGRAAKERSDIARAEDELAVLHGKLLEMEEEFQEEVTRLEEESSPADIEIEPKPLRPRKSDISVSRVALVWTPWRVGPDGIAEAACD